MRTCPKHQHHAPKHQGSRSALLCLATALCFGFSAPSPAASSGVQSATVFRVIVHPSNPTAAVSREFVADAFFKRTMRWQNGSAIRPVDLRPDSPVRNGFSDAVLQRSVAAVRSFWQQRIFSGRDLPPPELSSDQAVVDYVVKSPGAIGYVSTSANLGDAKSLVVR
jgi:ABC-type phosphate transport system substrate-binding protein